MGTPVSAGLVPAPVAPGRLTPATDPAELLRSRLAMFRRLQAERDAHAERCTGRALLPNPCAVLWQLDERLAALWGELLLLGVDLVSLYEPDPCAPECSDCAADPVPVAYTSVTADDWVATVDPRDAGEPRSVLDMAEAVGL